ncbi:MAG: hypothetical protein JJT78_10070 [Leptospira sp.]|nr:hypothetical protein [Leptospira sp.]
MNSPGGSLTISSLIPKFSVARVIALFFLFFIFFGSACIFISEKFTLSYVDSLYLSASAICVTGLSPIPLSSLSHSTHWIIMILVQIGGLGIITFTVLIGLLITQISN